ncbi:DUF4352 domain-containing protein [Listeria booriae]|uniref:DUF4352 domain-containing protein n=1 Tax=Listeria booriae TaxID=1552123 RepID=A0A842D1G6_9LIST|nr:DUF4352 domain-containing protein [Listeria booriae]MBC2004692.1 DUF4352 domain-containing protein [Listeria booriae]
MTVLLLIFFGFLLFLCLVALIVGVILFIVRKGKMLGALMMAGSLVLGFPLFGGFMASIIMATPMEYHNNSTMMHDDLMDGSTYDDTGGSDDSSSYYDDSDEYTDDWDEDEYYSDDYTQYKVGQAAEFEDGTWVTVSKLEKWTGDSEFQTPMAGFYVKATILFENKGKETVDFYADEFQIYDQDNFDGDNTYKEDWNLSLKPGAKATRTVYFDVYGNGPFHVVLSDVSWSGSVK